MSRWVELRRHSYTKKDGARRRGSRLSQEGVDAARVEGGLLRGVRYVGVSREPRTLETALAMGFAVDDVLDMEPCHVSGQVAFHEWWEWRNPWLVFRERIDARPALATFALTQVATVRKAVAAVEDDETVLLIGHGGWIEPTVVAALGRTALANWGPCFDHLEGVRLRFDNGTFQMDRIHRRRDSYARYADGNSSRTDRQERSQLTDSTSPGSYPPQRSTGGLLG